MSEMSIKMSDLTDETLQFSIDFEQKQIRRLNKEIRDIQAVIGIYQAELDRRALNAFWESHPDLLRLEPNDQLLSDTVKGYPTEVIKVNILENTCDVRWWVFDRTLNPHHWVNVPMERVQAMRKAYLAQEQPS